MQTSLLRSLRLLCASLALSALAPAAAPAAGAPTIDAREEKVLARVNAVRADRGLAPLRLDPKLSRSADRHSRRMQQRRTLSHRLPGEAALRPRLRWAVGGATVSEVIFWGSGRVGSAQMVRAWMQSGPHRATLLSSRYVRAGVGVRTGPSGSWATIDVAGR